MGRSTDKEIGLSVQRTYRSWTAKQKLEIVLAGLKGDRSVRDVCREHGRRFTTAGATSSLRPAGRRSPATRSVRYIDSYLDRPHSVNYKTPREVRATWADAEGALQKTAA